MTSAGAVYLAASSHEPTLRAMAVRILAATPRRPLRVAATYAAAGGPHVARMNAYTARLFDDAVVTRFTVAGEVPQPTPPADARATIGSADLIFVGGGDPIQGARLLVDSGADAWLRDARAGGTPCFGISAGAIMLAAWWAAWPDHPAPGAPHDGGELVRCVGVVPDLVVDCHAEEDDWNELHLVRNLLAEGRASSVSPAAPSPSPPPFPLRFLGIPTGRGVIVAPDGVTEFVAGTAISLPPLGP